MQRQITPLSGKIRRQIELEPSRGISFYQYMNMCLYDPEYGYYSQAKQKIGKNGDFYTSSSIGPLMGQMLAAYMVREKERLTGAGSPWIIVEWGGGDGRLAAHILDEMRSSRPETYRKLTYYMVEQSGYHRRLQRETLSAHLERVKFAGEKELDSELFADFSIILSNELLDAFPVYRVRYTDLGWMEIRVVWDDADQVFADLEFPLENPAVLENLRKERIELLPGQITEVNLAAVEWLRKQALKLRHGMIITIDYGDTDKEIYAPHRMHGTLMCYRSHMAHGNPYESPGEQDMTSHVNFGACLRAGEEAGMHGTVLQTQKQFLVEAGILDKLADHSSVDPFSALARQNRMVRQLLLSDGMSELFKVLVQYK